MIELSMVKLHFGTVETIMAITYFEEWIWDLSVICA